MVNSTPLTIYLPLKGRHLHTLRWMWHADRIRLPFHIVIADGEVNPVVAHVLEDSANFPNLSFEYHRYEDRSLTDFYRKCVDAVAKVQTPYVMISDNDDFLMSAGVKEAIAYLERNADFVCYGGRVAGFAISPRGGSITRNVVGPVSQLGFFYPARDFSNLSAAERVRFGLANYMPIYYNVHRTASLKLIFNEVVKCDFADVSIHELFTALRAMTLGKARTGPTTISYMRQHGTSLGSSQTMDWVQRVVSKSFMVDFQAMVSCIARAVASVDEGDQIDVEETIRAAFVEFLRFRLPATNSVRRNPIKAAIRPLLPSWLVEARIRGFKPIRVHRRAIIQELKRAGASGTYLEAFHSELRQVEFTLEGGAFLDFVRARIGDDLSVLA